MGLFDEQLAQVSATMEGWRRERTARDFQAAVRPPWPVESSLVLEEDTALELGNPALASLFLLLWGETADVEDGRITLIGPDIPELQEARAPFALVVIVGGDFSDEYDSYRDIRDAVYGTRLEGLSVRMMPSRQTIWCRVSVGAMRKGLCAADIGSALIDAIKEVEEVRAAEVLFVTSSVEDVRSLARPANGARTVVDAMMKMYQEMNYDCDECEYQEVCDTVMGLKKIREKLVDRKG